MSEARVESSWPRDERPGGGSLAAGRRTSLEILLVEDNPGDAELVREALSGLRAPHLEITAAGSLGEALAVLEDRPVDAVLLDLNLPDSRGLDTLRGIGEAAGNAAVVVLTGIDDEELALEALRRGAQDYLRKDEVAVTEAALLRVLLFAVERSRLQREVARGRADYAALIEQNADGILAVDADGVVRYANVAAAELLGARPNDLVGRDFGLPIIGGRWAEVELRDAAGDLRIAEMRATDTRWGAEHARLVVLHDVTERTRTEEALRRSEERYRTLYETMAQGAIQLDAEGRIVSANPAAERILGLTQEEMLARSTRDPRWRTIREDGSELPTEEQPAVIALETGRKILGGVMGVFNPADGAHRWIQVDAVPQLRAGEERPFQVSTVFVDVTERRRSEGRIRFLNRLLRTTSEINQMIVRERDRQRVVEEACRIAVEHGEFAAACAARLETDGRVTITACSGGAEGCVGCDTTLGDRCGPLGAAIRGGQPQFVDDVAEDESFPVWRRSALERGFRAAAALPVREGERVAGGFVVYADRPGMLAGEVVDLLVDVANDIGFALESISGQEARQRAEEGLRESERRFRLLFERNLAGVYRTTLEGEILECNDAFAQMFGYADRTELLGKMAGDTYRSTGERDAFVAALEEHGELRSWESAGVRKDGTRIPILENTTLVRDDEDGAFIEGSVIDLTEHKRTQAQLQQSQKLEAVGRLAGGVAHDFNNLLQVGVGLAELLRAEPGDEDEVRSAADELGALFERGAALTRQLLLFARREASERRACELGDVVRGVSSMLRRLMRETVDLRLDLAGPIHVEADRGQLEQVLVNLALNAAEAMPGGGRIVVRTGATGGRRVWLEVEDDGPGIPEEIRDRIFEPFFTTKGPGHGTGLGLSVVHGIVTDHGGEITVDTGEGRGTTFRILLPVAGSGGNEKVEAEPRDLSAPKADGRRVLVVEDQEAVRRVLERMLRRLGYEVVEVETAEAALGLDEPDGFDVLLSDVVLPGMAGTELAQRLRQRWPGLRVVLMSGYSEERILSGDDVGETCFLPKPFTLPVLTEVLAKALGDGD